MTPSEHAMMSILVARLGGRVEISMNELAMSKGECRLQMPTDRDSIFLVTLTASTPIVHPIRGAAS